MYNPPLKTSLSLWMHHFHLGNITFAWKTSLSLWKHHFHSENITFTWKTSLSLGKHHFHLENMTFTRKTSLSLCLALEKDIIVWDLFVFAWLTFPCCLSGGNRRKDGCWKVDVDPCPLPHPGTFRWRDLHRWHKHLRDRTVWSAIKAHNYSTGKMTRFSPGEMRVVPAKVERGEILVHRHEVWRLVFRQPTMGASSSTFGWFYVRAWARNWWLFQLIALSFANRLNSFAHDDI